MVIALILGLGLGLFYFGGLWITVQQIPRTQQPFPLIIVSFLLRLSIVVVGCYFLIETFAHQLVVIPLLIYFGGFLIARTLLISTLTFSPPRHDPHA